MTTPRRSIYLTSLTILDADRSALDAEFSCKGDEGSGGSCVGDGEGGVEVAGDDSCYDRLGGKLKLSFDIANVDLGGRKNEKREV